MAQLLFFGRFSDIMDNKKISLPTNVQDTQQLIEWLSQQDERFADQIARSGSRLIINEQLISTLHPVTDQDEIAFLSPVSGG